MRIAPLPTPWGPPAFPPAVAYPCERHIGPLDFDRDRLSFLLRTPLQRRLDVRFDDGRGYLRLERDLIADCRDARQMVNRFDRALPLIVPFHFAGEADPAALDFDFDVVHRQGSRPPQ